jgi:hypothetical protein
MNEQEVITASALSPAEATPHLTINHDVAADLDSTNAFEGEQEDQRICWGCTSLLTASFRV